MASDPPVLLSARVPPAVAYLWVRDHAESLRVLEAQGRNLVLAPGPEIVGREVLRAVEEIRAAAQLFRDQTLPATSARRNAEVPRRVEDAESGASSFPPGLTTRQVADQLGLKTSRQVTNLIASGRLVGHLVGRGWVVDEVSVARELDRRRHQ